MWLWGSPVRIRLPTPYPLLEVPMLGCSQVGKAPDFDSGIRRFESCHPSQYDPLAQAVEHLPFKQGVRSSSLRRITKNLIENFDRVFYYLFLHSVTRQVSHPIAPTEQNPAHNSLCRILGHGKQEHRCNRCIKHKCRY